MDKILCGVDIGGTKCSIALIDEKGKILDKIYSCAHVDKNETGRVKMVVENIKEIIKRNNLKESDLPGIGMGCAGHIRFRDGVIMTTSNLKGFDDMVFLTISTGIGAGIIINKKLYRGISGTAGEFGHTIVEPDSELTCTCGNRGCLMACACGMALPYLFEQKLKEGKKSKLNLPSNFIMSKLSGQFLKKGLEMDDPVSKKVILDCGYYAGLGIYNIFQALNPPLIVLGGGLTNWGDFYLDKIKSTFYDLARDMIFDPIEITVSKIIGDAGVIGAAALTLE